MQRPSYFWFCTLLIFLIGFILRIINLDGASLWHDESVTRIFVQQDSIQGTLKLLLHEQTQLPLYYALVQPLQLSNDFLIRLPNIYIALLGIAFLMRLAIFLYRDYRLALWLGGLLAINPYAIWLARTARVYMVFFLLVTITVYLFFHLIRGKRTTFHWTLFILASAALYITHYFAATIPMAEYIFFLFTLRGNRKFFWQWIGTQLIAIIPLLFWWYGLTQQVGIAFGVGWIPHPKLADFGLTFWNMSVGYEGSAHWYEYIGVLAAGLGIIVGLYYAIRYWKENHIDLFWVCLLIPPLVVIFLISFVRPFYIDRYFIPTLPALLFLIVRGWQQLGLRSPTTPFMVALPILVIAVCLTNFVIEYRNETYVHQDWRGAVTYIEQNRQPNDAVILEGTIMLPPFFAYFDESEIPILYFGTDDILNTPTPSPDYLWIVYQDGQADAHRAGEFPNFGFDKLPAGVQAWVNERRENVTVQKQFTGVILIGIQVKE